MSPVLLTLASNATTVIYTAASACTPYIETAGSYFPWMWSVAWGRFGIILAYICGGAVLTPLVAPLGLCLLGFTCWGVAAVSAAALCQSSIGNVPAGGCFACCQSAGAGGCGACYVVILVIMAVGGACLGGYIGYLKTCQVMGNYY